MSASNLIAYSYLSKQCTCPFSFILIYSTTTTLESCVYVMEAILLCWCYLWITQERCDVEFELWPVHWDILVCFRLFTTGCTNPRLLSADQVQALTDCGFDPALPVKFIVHGFLQYGEVQWVRDMAAELLRNVNT